MASSGLDSPTPPSAPISVRLGAVDALLRAIKDRPELSQWSASKLSDEFGLTRVQCESVLSGIRRAPPEPKQRFVKARLSIKDGWGGIVKLFGAVFDRAAIYIIASTAALAVFAIAVSVIGHFVPQLKVVFQAGLVVTFIGVYLLQAGAIFHNGKARFAIIAAGCTFVVTFGLAVFSALAIKQSEIQQIRLSRLELFGLTSVAALFISTLHALVGGLLAVTGGYMRMRREDKVLDRLGRKEFLKRYIEIQERLKLTKSSEKGLRTSRLRPIFRKFDIAISFVVGILLSLASSAAFFLDAPPMTAQQAAAHPSITIGNSHSGALPILVALLSIGVIVVIGYCSENIWKAILNSASCGLATWLMMKLPMNRNLEAAFMISVSHGGAIVTNAITVLVAVVAQVGSQLQRRGEREKLLRAGDPETLLEELAWLRWRLQDAERSVTVLVIDAARSSKMKIGEDAMKVEYVFRQYQDWISEIVGRFGGHVHAAVGDGAVAVFEDAGQAFSSAKRMQTEIPHFNKEFNVLSLPFRVRIGLHRGAVSGDIDEVVFTAVIDIAAHVEAVAPVGGIAVTTPALQDLLKMFPAERFAALPESVDGETVSVALEPTED